ncbi:MAG: hypothetical protein ACM3JD_03655 [Rudaea sp.]
MIRFVIAAAIVALVLVGGYFLYSNLNAQPLAQQAPIETPSTVATSGPVATLAKSALNKEGIPESIGSSPLKTSSTGKDALDEFSKLHGEGFDLVNGYRAEYDGAGGAATLYVGQAKDNAAADAMVKQMASKISEGNAMFTDLKELVISDRTIYQVSGQNQLHFFYAINDKIVWLATDRELAADGLHSIWGIVK